MFGVEHLSRETIFNSVQTVIKFYFLRKVIHTGQVILRVKRHRPLVCIKID